MSVDSVHLPLPFDFPVLITARESESSFTHFLINDLIHYIAKKKTTSQTAMAHHFVQLTNRM